MPTIEIQGWLLPQAEQSLIDEVLVQIDLGYEITEVDICGPTDDSYVGFVKMRNGKVELVVNEYESYFIGTYDYFNGEGWDD